MLFYLTNKFIFRQSADFRMLPLQVDFSQTQGVGEGGEPYDVIPQNFPDQGSRGGVGGGGVFSRIHGIKAQNLGIHGIKDFRGWNR